MDLTGPALLLAVESDLADRRARVKQDWAASRPVVRQDRTTGRRRPALTALRRRAVRLLHA